MTHPKRLTVVLLLATLAGSASAGDFSDPEQWYRQSYAPLWAEQPWDHSDALAAHYADPFQWHGAEGSFEVDPLPWLQSALLEWREDGWQRSDIDAIDVDPINDHLVAFRTRWADRFSDRPVEHTCGWYLARRTDTGWAFTDYADFDCARFPQP